MTQMFYWVLHQLTGAHSPVQVTRRGRTISGWECLRCGLKHLSIRNPPPPSPESVS